jgi:hypothetical protein
MRRVWLTTSLLALLLVLSNGCSTMPCQEKSIPSTLEVTVLTNRDYFPAVHKLFQEAESSISVMMFSARYYTEKPSFAGDIEHVPGTHWSNTNVLLDDLVAAQERGVQVLVILDSSTWNKSNTELNESFAQLLLDGGVSVYMDDPEVTTHTKLIIVDDRLTVIGSTNWSYYALDANNETSVLIQSPEINKSYREFFSQVLASSTPLSMTEGN